MSNENKALIHSFIPDISLASLQAHYYSEAPPLHRRYCVGVNTPQRYWQRRVNNLQKFHMWWLEWDSNLLPFVHKAPNIPLSRHAPHHMLHCQLITIERPQKL